MEKEMLAEVQLRGVCNMPDATQKLGTIWTIVGTRLGEWLNFWIQISNKNIWVFASVLCMETPLSISPLEKRIFHIIIYEKNSQVMDKKCKEL